MTTTRRPHARICVARVLRRSGAGAILPTTAVRVRVGSRRLAVRVRRSGGDMGQDGGFERQQVGPVCRRGFLVGAGTAAVAVGLAGYEGRARASSAAAAQATGGGPETTRSISLSATPLQNQFAAWALEYVAGAPMSARSTPSPTTWPRMTTARTTRRGTATRSATAPRPTRRSGGAGTTRPATTTCGHGVRGRQLQAVVREAGRSPPEGGVQHPAELVRAGTGVDESASRAAPCRARWPSAERVLPARPEERPAP